jgi:hypothetical protein
MAHSPWQLVADVSRTARNGSKLVTNGATPSGVEARLGEARCSALPRGKAQRACGRSPRAQPSRTRWLQPTGCSPGRAVKIARDQDHGQSLPGGAQHAGCGAPVEGVHVDLHQQHIGSKPLVERNRLCSVMAAGDELEARVRLDQRRGDDADRSIVVDMDNAHALPGSVPLTRSERSRTANRENQVPAHASSGPSRGRFDKRDHHR